jgi:hypothetical protein
MITLPLAEIGNLVELSSAGLKMHPDITEEQSRNVFQVITQMDTSMDFIIGDWIHQHSTRFGRTSAEEILNQLEFDFVRALRCEKIATIPPVDRNVNLSSAHHHAVVRNVTNPEQQQEWLKTAEGKKLAPDELARSIRAGRVIKNEERNREYSNDAGLPVSIESVALKFMGWLKFVEANDPIADWDNRRLESLSGLLSPMSQTHERIRAMLDRKI